MEKLEKSTWPLRRTSHRPTRKCSSRGFHFLSSISLSLSPYGGPSAFYLDAHVAREGHEGGGGGRRRGRERLSADKKCESAEGSIRRLIFSLLLPLLPPEDVGRGSKGKRGSRRRSVAFNWRVILLSSGHAHTEEEERRRKRALPSEAFFWQKQLWSALKLFF